MTHALHLVGYSLLAVITGLCAFLLVFYFIFVFVEVAIEERE